MTPKNQILIFTSELLVLANANHKEFHLL